MEQSLEENNAKLEEQNASFENDLKQYYSLKAQETIVELKFESWKQLYRKQESELAEKQAKMRDVKLNIWRDREEFCEYASSFSKEFSMEKSLNRLRRAANDEDSPIAKEEKFDFETRLEMDAHLIKMAEVEGEIAILRRREAELEKAERELSPDEDTVRRLQTAVSNSVSSLEEIEAQIKPFDDRSEDSIEEATNDKEVKSILKRPSFLAKEIERKQVRFE